MEILGDQTNRFLRSTADGQFFRKGQGRTSYDKNLNTNGFPMITMVIMAVNTILFFVTPKDMVERLCSLPLDDFGLPHLMLTTMTSAFIHLDFSHLFINMLFLWVFGAFLEPRIAPGQYLAAVLLGSVLSSLISLNLIVSQVGLLDVSMKLLRFPPTGASGAIAGLMGLCALRYGAAWRSASRSSRRHRLYFFPVPIGAAVLIGIFLISDFTGTTVPATGMTNTFANWGKLGGFLGGLVLALVFALQDEDLYERRGAGKCLDSKLKEGADYRHHLEMAMQVRANASIQPYFLPIEPLSKETLRGNNATGSNV